MPYIGFSPGMGTRDRFIYTATASQTTFSGADDNGKTLRYDSGDFVDVYLNGILLVPVTDYTATSLTSIVLTQAASADDTLEVLSLQAVTVADTVSKSQGGRFEDVVTFDTDINVGTTTKFNYSGSTTEITVGSSGSGSNSGGAVTFVSDDGGTQLGYVGFQESEAQIGTMGTRDLRLATQNKRRFTVKSGGNVEMEPDEVSGMSGEETNSLGFRIRQTNGQNVLLGSVHALGRSGWGGALIFTAKDDNSNVNDTQVDCVRIEPSSTGASGKLSVGTPGNLDDTNGGCLQVISTDTSDHSGDCLAYFETAGNDWLHTLNYNNATSTKYFIQFKDRGTTTGSIRGNTTSVSYYTSSDHRLKENVVELTGATTRLKQLEPKRFNFIVDADTTVDGFLAHEVQTVVPEAISGTHNEVETWTQQEIDAGDAPANTSAGDNKLDGDGNTIPVYQGIDQSKLVPLLTAALQEAIAKIETLETEMTSVKSRLDALEAN